LTFAKSQMLRLLQKIAGKCQRNLLGCDLDIGPAVAFAAHHRAKLLSYAAESIELAFGRFEILGCNEDNPHRGFSRRILTEPELDAPYILWKGYPAHDVVQPTGLIG
jgi:hypothetical protein